MHRDTMHVSRRILFMHGISCTHVIASCGEKVNPLSSCVCDSLSALFMKVAKPTDESSLVAQLMMARDSGSRGSHSVRPSPGRGDDLLAGLI